MVPDNSLTKGPVIEVNLKKPLPLRAYVKELTQGISFILGVMIPCAVISLSYAPIPCWTGKMFGYEKMLYFLACCQFYQMTQVKHS